MLCKLVGYRKVDFTNPDNQQRIQGTKLYLIASEKNPNIVGAETFQQFVGTQYEVNLAIGANYDITYNRSGRMQAIKKVD